MQLQQAQIQAQLNALNAKAAADQGLAQERQQRVITDQAQALEKIHEANKNDAQATLDMIKAIKELQSIDLTQLQTLITLANTLKQQEQATTQINTSEAGTVPNFDRGMNLAAPEQPMQ